MYSLCHVEGLATRTLVFSIGIAILIETLLGRTALITWAFGLFLLALVLAAQR